MSQHMVIFQNHDGDPGYNQFESIDEAVVFVEKLRNEQGIQSIRIFELEEVKFELKPIFKVELLALKSGSGSSPAVPSPAAPSTPAAAPPSGPPMSTQPAPPPPSDEPVGGSPFSSPAPPPSGPPAGPSAAPGPEMTPPADRPEEGDQPSRRGLFGR